MDLLRNLKEIPVDPMIKLCFDYVLPISNDRVLATHGDEISLITSDGELIVTYDSIELACYDIENPEWDVHKDYNGNLVAPESIQAYVDGVLIIIEDGKYGLINYDGDIILEPQYNHIGFISQTEFEVW